MSESILEEKNSSINIDFRIDKNDILDKFKTFIKNQNNIRSAHQVSDEISKTDILERIKNIYEFVLKEAILSLRSKYIHDEDIFKKVKHLLESYIANKVRSRTDGIHYINVNDLVSFTGDIEKYEEWIVKDKRKLYKLVRSVLEELNNLLSGKDLEDMNKTVIVESPKRNILDKNYIASKILEKIPENYLLEFNEYKFKNFAISFNNIMINDMNIDENDSFEFLKEIVSKQLKSLVERKD